jgi:hypothetical protein
MLVNYQTPYTRTTFSGYYANSIPLDTFELSPNIVHTRKRHHTTTKDIYCTTPPPIFHPNPNQNEEADIICPLLNCNQKYEDVPTKGLIAQYGKHIPRALKTDGISAS